MEEDVLRPVFIIFVLVLACLLTGMALLAVFKVDGDNRTVNAVLIAIGSVVGLALLLNCRTWWQVTDSVLNSQRKSSTAPPTGCTS